ncbi:hypothetical protein ABH935_007030 [Catenulispora sp. GAS73]|uniref:hypothetical protein n=1 Tax=Catenulispora sp. GAS73 TaxID=3156269 RepID=UPI0035117CF0
MSDTEYNPLADRATGLTLAASGLTAAAEQVHTIAKLILEGMNALRGDLTREAPQITDDSREPGFFRVHLGAGALMDPADRGNLHLRMAAVAAGFPEPGPDEVAFEARHRLAGIIADLWSAAVAHDLNVGQMINDSMTILHERLRDGTPDEQ